MAALGGCVMVHLRWRVTWCPVGVVAAAEMEVAVYASHV